MIQREGIAGCCQRRWSWMFFAVLLWSNLHHHVHSMQHNTLLQGRGLSESFSTHSSKSPRCKLVSSTSESSMFELQSSVKNPSRRTVVSSLLTIAGGGQVLPAYSEDAEAVAGIQKSCANLQCLLDLPPIPEDSIRVFLCRHGQTENNRLHLIQGARVDPPLNQNGIAMAQRLGLALAQLPKPVTTMFHSTLIRSRQTADEAFQQMKRNDRLLARATTRTLPALSEVDFGSVEGKPAREVRLDMALAYAAWTSGNIDFRLEGGGESGREVLQRASRALWQLVHAAKLEPTRQVVAISHSTFQHVLLAALLNTSLAQAALIEQVNGCINVIDLKKNDSLQFGPKCKLLGGVLSQATNDFILNVPIGSVLRINEKRHLEGILA